MLAGRAFAVLFALACGTAIAYDADRHVEIYLLSQQASQEAPGINAKQQANNPPASQKDGSVQAQRAGPSVTAPSSSASVGDNPSGRDAKDAGEEGTEFWPAFHGVRLKITDTLLTFFTCGLFGATIYLYFATRDLVKGADEAAQRQLRAYVALEGIHWEDAATPQQALIIKAKNYGQTAAHGLEIYIADATTIPLTGLQMLHPGQIVIQRAPIAPTDNSWKQNPVFLGAMSYQDAFGRWWVTRIAYQYGGANNSDFIVGARMKVPSFRR